MATILSELLTSIEYLKQEQGRLKALSMGMREHEIAQLIAAYEHIALAIFYVENFPGLPK